MNTILIPANVKVIASSIVKKKLYSVCMEAMKAIKEEEIDPRKRTSRILNYLMQVDTREFSLHMLSPNIEFDSSKISLKDDEIIIYGELNGLSSISI